VKETTFIAKLFKHTNWNIAFKTNNSVQHNLRPQKKKNNLSTIATNTFQAVFINSHVPTMARHMLARQTEVLPKYLKNTTFLLGTTILPQNLHKIS
jgi:hypothetical protein